MDVLTISAVFLPSIFGGIVQATTGFGFGIFVMLFFPMVLPILKSSALSSLIGLVACATLAWQYRKKIKPTLMLVPALFYFIASFIAIRLAVKMDMGGLKAYFGLFLIVVAVWFIFFSNKVHIKANIISAFVCATISGFASGFFGIGGPPMVIYMLAAIGDDKEGYLANSQFYFMITSIYTTTVRIFSGIITADIWLLLIPGVLGMIIGKSIGLKIVNRINIDLMKKLIYAFLAISGLITFITNI